MVHKTWTGVNSSLALRHLFGSLTVDTPVAMALASVAVLEGVSFFWLAAVGVRVDHRVYLPQALARQKQYTSSHMQTPTITPTAT